MKKQDPIQQLSERVSKLGKQMSEMGTRLETKTSELGERIDTLSVRIDKLDTKTSELSDRLDTKTSELGDQMAKMYAHFEQRFDSLEERKADKVDLDRIYKALDAILANQGVETAERAAIVYQVDRHEGWIARASGQVGILYEGAA